ncbi:MAG: GDP-mannose 4,6-dehydratase [Armatimonadetes bacterium]|nr:GDP-mannose 4,6-dehydratase [Anaerolineae bacterium]
MSYLVTGGAGFVGSHLAEALLKRGERVVVLDNFNDYYDPALKRHNIERISASPNLTVVEGDIRDVPLVKRLFAEHGIMHVGHMAAMANVRESIQKAPLYMDVNVTGTMNLLEAARDHQVKQFVLASTSSVYGDTPNLPFVETDTADHPLASYPASKRSAELLAHTYYHLFGLNVTCVRFFNVYGPAGRPDMMPIKLLDAALSSAPINVFNGGNYQRDWTYIDDTVQGVVAALDTPLGYEVINLGVGKPIALNDFIDIIEEITARKINRVEVDAPKSDPPITFCNNEKARRLLGFAPQITVQDGLPRVWAWYRQFNHIEA